MHDATSAELPDPRAASPAKVGARSERLLHALGSKRGLATLVGLGFALASASLGAGFSTDDHMLLDAFRRGVSPFGLFHMPAPMVSMLRDMGQLSWWTSPGLSIRFLRPLSSLSHYLDFIAWGDNPVAMHAVNCLLYAALVATAAFAYRALLPRATAALAALMFTIDEGHAAAIGWISGRNTVLATLFGMLAVLLQLRARTSASMALRVAAPLCTALALLSGEMGLCALAYIAAHALVLESGPLRARLSGVAPHFAVAAGWAALYVGGGFGARGAGLYRDPFGSPISTALDALADLPLWCFGELGLNVINLGLLFPSAPARLVALVCVLPLLGLLLPSLRHSAPARFFALGMALCIAPLCMTLPQDRLLLGASFGGLGWLACFARQGVQHASLWFRSSRALVLSFHLALAPLVFVPALFAVRGLERAAQALSRTLPGEVGRHVVIVNLPFELLTFYASVLRGQSGEGDPARLHLLYAGGSELAVDRVDARTLDMRVERGFGFTRFERFFVGSHGFPRPGATVRVTGMRATVLESTPSGAPTRVRFEFDESLESPKLAWRFWQLDHPAPWTPPSIGESAHVPGFPILRAMP